MVIQETSLKKIKSVILIDDNEIDNFINRKILENYGVTNILTFTSANDALSYLKQSAGSPELILLDLYMPVMNGFEFIDEFKKLEIEKQPIDICILSASINPGDVEEVQKVRQLSYTEKPLTALKAMTLLKEIKLKNKIYQDECQ